MKPSGQLHPSSAAHRYHSPLLSCPSPGSSHCSKGRWPHALVLLFSLLVISSNCSCMVLSYSPSHIVIRVGSIENCLPWNPIFSLHDRKCMDHTHDHCFFVNALKQESCLPYLCLYLLHSAKIWHKLSVGRSEDLLIK